MSSDCHVSILQKTCKLDRGTQPGGHRCSGVLRAMVLLVASFGCMHFCTSAENSSPGDTAKTRAALVQSLKLNGEYCNQWISANDFKSLAKTVGELPILVAAVNRLTSESDSAKMDTLRKAITALATAAKDADGAAAKTAMAQLKSATEAAAEAKVAEMPKAIEKAPGGFGPLMAIIDGTFADGKTAATVGDAAEAKQSALALAELSRYLAVDRNDERWKKQSEELVAAANAAAATDATDSKALRKVFHDVYDRCEACHSVRRPNRK